jgi:hypothetical protein
MSLFINQLPVNGVLRQNAIMFTISTEVCLVDHRFEAPIDTLLSDFGFSAEMLATDDRVLFEALNKKLFSVLSGE